MTRKAPASGLISRGTASEANRARVLQALYDTGPLSRAELARLTGVSRAAIGTIVQGMLDREVLAEGEPRPSTAAGGKPSRPLWFSPDAPPIIAAHLLPGTVEAALVSAGGDVLDTTRRAFDTDLGEQATNSLVACVEHLLERGGRKPMGIGIAVGGLVDTDAGTLVQMALAPALDGLPIGPHVASAAGLPTWIDQHPRVQALGDRWFGQGRGLSDFASLYTGEAIGVGLVVDGLVHRGVGGSGGEVGHTTVCLGGRRCRCGRDGCWETIATHDWLRREAGALGLPGASTLTSGPLARLAAMGVPGALDLLDTYAYHLAVGMANLHQTHAPGLFILHGDCVAGGEALRGRIERHLHNAVPPHPAGPPQVAFSTLDDRATLLGSAALVLSRILQVSV